MRAGSYSGAGTPGNWHFIGFTLDGGTEQPRIYMKDLDTDTWIASAELMDWTFCCDLLEELDRVIYGAGGPTLIAAQWDEIRSSSDMEDLGDDLRFSTWLDTARSDMILGHRFNTTSLNDFSGNGASEASRTDVSLVADAPTGWQDDIPNPCPSDPFAAAQSSAASTVCAWNEELLRLFRLGGPPPGHEPGR